MNFKQVYLSEEDYNKLQGFATTTATATATATIDHDRYMIFAILFFLTMLIFALIVIVVCFYFIKNNRLKNSDTFFMSQIEANPVPELRNSNTIDEIRTEN